MDKSALRKEIKTRCHALTGAYIKEAGDMIERKIISSDFFKESKSIFVYIGTESEPSTKEIISAALKSGKRVFVPKCLKDGIMKAVEINALAVFFPGMFGIPEPENGEEYKDDFDIAIIPCVTAAKSGERLGHGKGYYDRFLSSRETKKICLCFDRLLSDYIPTDGNDIKMDIIVTENEIISTENI